MMPAPNASVTSTAITDTPAQPADEVHLDDDDSKDEDIHSLPSDEVKSSSSGVTPSTNASDGSELFDISEIVGTDSSSSSSNDKISSDIKSGDYFVMPQEGKSIEQKWSNNSPLAADLIASGSFDQAMHRLSRTIGAVNFSVLKPYFMSIYSSVHCQVSGLSSLGPFSAPIQRSFSSKDEKTLDLPEILYKLNYLCELRTNAYELMKNYLISKEEKKEDQLPKITSIFHEILHVIPLISLDKKAQIVEVNELVETCKEYLTAIKFEMSKKETQDPVKQLLLSAYLTRCKLKPHHLVQGLRLALMLSFKTQYYKTCAGFCHRILDLCLTSPQLNLANVPQVKHVLQQCEGKGADPTDLSYSESEPLTLCCASLTPITKGMQTSRCPYCSATYKQDYNGTLCRICVLSKIGSEVTGLRVFAEQ